MSVTTQSYNLGKIKQLVDLNGDSTNFDLTFNATSKDGKEFEALVVDQTMLDNDPNPQYKKAEKGTISGNIVADKNVYQNYFLLLRSTEPCEVEVKLVKKEIQPAPQQVPTPSAPASAPPQQAPVAAKKKSRINWKLILIAAVVIGGGIALYFMYFKKKKSNSVTAEETLPSVAPIVRASPVHASSPAQSLASSVASARSRGSVRSSVASSSPSSAYQSSYAASPSPAVSVDASSHRSENVPVANQSLLTRLKRLHMTG